MATEGAEMSVQGKFFTRDSEYSVPSDAIALEGRFDSEHLSAIINRLLNREGDDEVEFEFLIQENILLGSIKEHLEENGLSTENVTEVSCVDKYCLRYFHLSLSYHTGGEYSII